MLEVNYYFYYHLNPEFPADEIVNYINEKDYDNFIEAYHKWGDFYLPPYAVACAEGDDIERFVCVDITDEHNFKMITYCEYECG